MSVGSDAETIRRLAPSFIELMGLSLGRERIELEVVSPTSSIVCHAVELEISTARLALPDGSEPLALDIAFDNERERVRTTRRPPGAARQSAAHTATFALMFGCGA